MFTSSSIPHDLFNVHYIFSVLQRIYIGYYSPTPYSKERILTVYCALEERILRVEVISVIRSLYKKKGVRRTSCATVLTSTSNIHG